VKNPLGFLIFAVDCKVWLLSVCDCKAAGITQAVELSCVSSPGFRELSSIMCIPMGSLWDAGTETEHSNTLAEEEKQQFDMTEVNINTS